MVVHMSESWKGQLRDHIKNRTMHRPATAEQQNSLLKASAPRRASSSYNAGMARNKRRLGCALWLGRVAIREFAQQEFTHDVHQPYRDIFNRPKLSVLFAV